MNLRWIVMFAAVAEERSFTAAATRLNVAQPWISAQVRKLEAEIGVQLFHRVKNRTELTEEGEALLPIARQLAQAAERFRNAARDLDTSRGSVVQLGTHVPAISIPELVAVNDDFTRRYPRFSLNVERGSTEDLVHSVRGGVLDFACVASPFEGGDMETVLLHRCSPYLLGSAKEGWARGQTIALSALAGRQVGVLPAEAHAALSELLRTPLHEAGVVPLDVSDPYRQAMERFVRVTGTPVLMIEGDPEDYADTPDLIAVAVEPMLADVEQVLIRLQSGLMGRATERYWRLATEKYRDGPPQA